LIPDESGSEPFHNWNERVNDRCYRPNAEIGNFSKISFNIGPTLVRWMEAYSIPTLENIVAADKRNVKENGVGNAMAQPYHHTILPLASKRDKEIQIRWGIADFNHTYGRAPQGMWLPEAAVDMETLSVLAQEGIQFTVLSPVSAAEDFDRNQPYRVELPGGKSIVVFFYNDQLSSNVSFNPEATSNAERFASDFLSANYTGEEQDQLVLVATDGELYGHHQPFREKFLAYLLDGVLLNANIRTTYPALWLREHEVKSTINIRENTSWSCAHGVTRWRDVCDCTPAGEWKKGLRETLNHAALLVDEVYLKAAGEWLKDPDQAREEIIHFVLGEEKFEDWTSRNVKSNFSYTNALALRKLMQAQFERQRMFTSCGWFFEHFDRIEPRNNLKYTAQAITLTESATGLRIMENLLPDLKKISSQINGTSAENFFSTLVDQFRAKTKPF
jgi:alpha-amylase/alpha-mannosidase (GH57 family)